MPKIRSLWISSQNFDPMLFKLLKVFTQCFVHCNVLLGLLVSNTHILGHKRKQKAWGRSPQAIVWDHCLLVVHIFWRFYCSSIVSIVLFYCFYLEKIWCFKMSFGLLYDGFIFNLPECILFLFRTEAENTSIPPVDVQMTFTKGSGTCSVYLEMQFSGAWMHIKDKRVGWELAGEKKKKRLRKSGPCTIATYVPFSFHSQSGYS